MPEDTPGDLPEIGILSGDVAGTGDEGDDGGEGGQPPVQPLTDDLIEYFFNLRTRGGYIMDEDKLPEGAKLLLHGRSYIIDRSAVTAIDSGSASTYYLAADKVQGLVVPARSLSIENTGPGSMYYRWTDDGEKWTSWVTMDEGVTHEFAPDEKCRFAEVQVYVETSGALLSLRATR